MSVYTHLCTSGHLFVLHANSAFLPKKAYITHTTSRAPNFKNSGITYTLGFLKLGVRFVVHAIICEAER
ncbi:MAG: hypothetical protein R3Y23_06310, partial [Bacillota bacterium]